MMRGLSFFALAIMLSLSLAACQQSEFRFAPDYWYSDAMTANRTNMEQETGYIPIAAIPPLPDLLTWTPKDRETLAREVMSP